MKGDIQSFTGMIDRNCKGTMNIPDIGLKNFEYYEPEYTIIWENQQTGEKWVKGKNFYNLRLFENKDLFR